MLKIISTAIVTLLNVSAYAGSTEFSSNLAYEDENYTVMGFTEQEILEMSGEYRDRYSNIGRNNALSCSEDHEKDDLANQWCHAGITKAIGKALVERGINPRIAAALASTFFIPKEYLVDKNASMSDLVFTIEEYFGENKDSAIELTLFADGAVFVAIKKRF